MAAPPKKMGMSLYADLLNKDKANSGATISAAPVRYDQKRTSDDGSDAEQQKKKQASLQFQPIRRPQVPRPKQPVNKPSHTLSSSTTTASLVPAASSPAPITSTPSQVPSLQRSNFSDWVGDEDEDYYIDRPKHERGGKKKKKKKQQQKEAARMWDWEDIYDPTLPNVYADYKGSEEQVRETRDWKARLYYHKMREARKKQAEREKMAIDEVETREKRLPSHMFAPPPSLNSAPPSFDDSPTRSPAREYDDDKNATPNQHHISQLMQQPAPAASSDATGEDASLRRMQMSSIPAAQPTPPFSIETASPSSAPSTTAGNVQSFTSEEPSAADLEAKRKEAAAKVAAFKAKLAAHKAAKAGNDATSSNDTNVAPVNTAPPVAVSAPAVQPQLTTIPSTTAADSGATIIRAPVRYEQPPQPLQLPDMDGDSAVPVAASAAQEAPRSNRPGQKGFAERYLEKMGWEKGKGLGAEGNEGIATAIFAKAEKRKKRSDAEGGGWAQPANMGKIVGGKRRKVAGDENDDGADGDTSNGTPSEVMKLEGMLEGLDVDDEIQNKDLYGEIGREMEGQYGKVERVFIWRKANGGQDDVFVKFTSPLSALRAVHACDGDEFAGNVMKATFFDKAKFEAGEYTA